MDVSEESPSTDLRVRRLRRVVVCLSLLAALGAALLYWQREAVWLGWWDWRATHSASSLELDTLQSCEPRWWTVRRALEQDLEAGCDLIALGNVMGERVRAHPLRVRWVRQRLEHPSQRTRARALMALIAAETELPLDVSSRVARLLDVPEHHDAIVDALLEERLVAVARHPAMERDLLMRGIERDVVSDDVLVGELLLGAGWPLGPNPVLQPVRDLVETRSDMLAEDLRVQTKRRALGRGFGMLPEHLTAEAASVLGACDELESSSCDVARAQLLAASSPLGDTSVRTGQLFEPAEGLQWVLPLWEVDATVPKPSAQVGVDWLGRRAAWVALGPTEAARTDRLRRLVLAEEHRFTGAAAGDGMVGDPVYVARAGAGSSWATALAAVAIGGGAGVPVAVSSHPEGVVLVIGDRDAVRVGPCGERAPASAPEQSLSNAQVLARTAAERAEGHARAGRSGPAAALAALARRLDPSVSPRVGTVERVELLSGVGTLPATAAAPPMACLP